MFITRLLAEGRATADATATLVVLRHLAQQAGQGQHNGDSSPTSPEDAFVAVLQTANLQGRPADSLLAAVLGNIRVCCSRHPPHFGGPATVSTVGTLSFSA